MGAALVIEVCAPDAQELLRLAVPPNCGVIGQFLPTCRGCAKFLGQRHSACPALPDLLARRLTMIGSFAY